MATIVEPADSQTFHSGGPTSSDDTASPELLTVEEAAQFLKVSVSWIYEHVRPGTEDRLPVVKIGKYLRFDMRDLRAYIDAKREASRHPRRRR